MGTHVSYTGFRHGFPFPIRETNELGDPIDIWLGTTLYEGEPSGSASQAVTVVGDRTKYPVGFTREQFAEFFWRVRSFKLAFEFEAEVSGDVTGSGSSAGVDMPRWPKKRYNGALASATVPDDEDAEELPDEAALITGLTNAAAATAGRPNTAVFVREELLYETPFPVIGDWIGGEYSGDAVLYYLSWSVFFHDTCFSEGLYYPRMSLEMWAPYYWEVLPQGACFLMGCQGAHNYDPIAVPIAICGALGSLICTSGAPSPSFDAISATGNFALTPYEYWPYATSEGDPAWDAEDGTPLNGGPGA